MIAKNGNLRSLEKIDKCRELYSQQLKAQVNTAVDLYIESLQASRVRTLKEIDAESSEESKHNQTQKQHLRSTVTRINSGLKFGLKALQCHDDTQRIAAIGQAMSQLKPPIKPPSVQTKINPAPRALVVEDIEKTPQILLREFKSSDISISGGAHAHTELGKKSHLKITIRMKPVGIPQFRFKYGPSYQCSLTPQTTLKSDDTWLLQFTPCCGGKHAVSACIYGVWISVSPSADFPTFYVTGALKEGDIVRRVPPLCGTPTKAKETIGKVTSVKPNYVCRRAGYTLQVKWITGDQEFIQWGDPYGYPLELVL